MPPKLERRMKQRQLKRYMQAHDPHTISHHGLNASSTLSWDVVVVVQLDQHQCMSNLAPCAHHTSASNCAAALYAASYIPIIPAATITSDKRRPVTTSDAFTCTATS